MGLLVRRCSLLRLCLGIATAVCRRGETCMHVDSGIDWALERKRLEAVRWQQQIALINSVHKVEGWVTRFALRHCDAWPKDGLRGGAWKLERRLHDCSTEAILDQVARRALLVLLQEAVSSIKVNILTKARLLRVSVEASEHLFKFILFAQHILSLSRLFSCWFWLFLMWLGYNDYWLLLYDKLASIIKLHILL